MPSMRVERLDHLGIVAGICREIGLAGHLASSPATSISATPDFVFHYFPNASIG